MSNNIDISVCYFKPSKVFQSDALKPMQLGKAASKVDLGFRGDDTGDNISDKNKYYGEETAFYWLWKNSQADIKGCMQYHRLFDLNSVEGQDRNIVLEDIGSLEQFVLDLGLDNKNISKIMKNFDVIISKKCEISGWNIEEQYKASHAPEYLDYAIDIIKQDFPDIYPAARRVLAGNSGWFTNFMIMKSGFFNSLCEFKFSVLGKLEKTVDVKRPEIASGWQYTTPYIAAVGERLTMFYVEHLLDKGAKIIEFPAVNIISRDAEDKRENFIKPVFEAGAIVVMMAANNKYAPYCGVMLQSIIDNASPGKNYDIIIAGGKISDKNKKLIELMARPNISVRVIEISKYIDSVDMEKFYVCGHFSVETYYRFFIPKLFVKYDKILYLDCDMVVNRDIAELYLTDIGDNWWGVTRETLVSVLGFTEGTADKRKFLPYIKNTLKMGSVFDYFQGGVMIWNIKKVIEDDVANKCLEKLKEIGKPQCVDQCVMNSVANGKNVFWLSQYWNVSWCAPFCWSEGKGNNAYKTAMHLLEDPYILHYYSGIKPWDEPLRPNTHLFWQYARKTPFYEIILHGKTMTRKHEKKLKKINRKIKIYKVLQSLTFGAVKSFRRKENRYREEAADIKEMYE